jgi:serine/threonine-protein kinase
VLKTPGTSFPSSWTLDGKTLLYSQLSGHVQAWMMPAPGSGDGKPRRLFGESSFNLFNERISPDGRWVAYQSDELGMYQVSLRPFPGPGGQTPVSVDGGTYPMWSDHGRKLFFLGRNQMMSVDVETGPVLHLSAPRALFPLQNARSLDADVALDGKRFLMALPPQASGSFAADVKLQVIENWFEDLRRMAPERGK